MARGEIVKSCEMYVTRYKIINQKLYCYVELDNRHSSLQSVSLLRTAQLHARTFLFGDSDPCASPNKQRNDNTSGISIACPPPVHRPQSRPELQLSYPFPVFTYWL